MLNAHEYQLRAENCATAARIAETVERREYYLRAAAICRNKALRIQLGANAGVLRRCPFRREQLGRF